MHISLRKNHAKFNPNPIWNEGGLGFFEDSRHNNKNNNKMSTQVGSVPDPKIYVINANNSNTASMSWNTYN